jgi:hypothetical protein
LSYRDLIEEAIRAAAQYGSKKAAADALGIPRSTLRHRIDSAGKHGISPTEFETPYLPEEIPAAEELLERRRKEYKRVDAARTARKLINVKVKLDGPIGIMHMGDPHVDDSSTDICAIEADVKSCQETEGLFAATVGDLQNGWVGRLARLYGEQSTSAAEAWVLVEWLITSVPWLYVVKGNHDLWTGSGDPLDFMMRGTQGVLGQHDARLNLVFPNKKQVRVNARHDFPGHSMWNTVHGAAKAAKMGWRDHILVCGHKHISGYAVDKDPATGLISHILRVAGYKIHDNFARERGLPDQNIFSSCVTIIDPQYADSDARLITTIMDIQEGAEYLTWKRQRG